MDSFTPTADEVLFVPLGGAGEIGMNFTLYGHDGAWLAVDLGITFGGEDFPDYEILMADPKFAMARRDRLCGLFLTHAHEDHIGAVPYLWRRLRCPIYATAFTAAVLRQKFQRTETDEVPIIEVRAGARTQTGPFTVEYIRMTHSIPEPHALLIETPLGAVFHSGDWKLDDRPVVGPSYDQARLMSLQRRPLLALVCDSTNAATPGRTPSESELLAALEQLGRNQHGRIIVTTFASNIGRMVALAMVARALGRRFGVVGPAMQRMVEIARSTGHWPVTLPELVESAYLGHLPREEVLVACTGSQGESRSTLAQLAADRHRHLLIDPGDLVIFSSRRIPGNERAINELQDRLRDLGARVVTDDEAPVHVSGHPAQDDLRRLYGWLQPPVLIPVHGTPRHLRANAVLAESCHIPRALIIEDGDICRLRVGGADVCARAESGRLGMTRDGRLVSIPAAVVEAMRAAAR